jgi:hypothetical protein
MPRAKRAGSPTAPNWGQGGDGAQCGQGALQLRCFQAGRVQNGIPDRLLGLIAVLDADPHQVGYGTRVLLADGHGFVMVSLLQGGLQTPYQALLIDPDVAKVQQTLDDDHHADQGKQQNEVHDDAALHKNFQHSFAPTD